MREVPLMDGVGRYTELHSQVGAGNKEKGTKKKKTRLKREAERGAKRIRGGGPNVTFIHQVQGFTGKSVLPRFLGDQRREKTMKLVGIPWR